jgi:hypothetical protein
MSVLQEQKNLKIIMKGGRIVKNGLVDESR